MGNVIIAARDLTPVPLFTGRFLMLTDTLNPQPLLPQGEGGSEESS
jgi:hypothetical protein